MYVLHTNWLYYMLYSVSVSTNCTARLLLTLSVQVVLWPILSLWSKSGQFIVLEEPDDLLEHFDEDQLFLLRYAPLSYAVPGTHPCTVMTQRSKRRQALKNRAQLRWSKKEGMLRVKCNTNFLVNSWLLKVTWDTQPNSILPSIAHDQSTKENKSSVLLDDAALR